MTTLTIMRILPREVDPMVYKMSLEDPGGATFAGIGGLGEQVRELREVIELPLMNPELFIRVGIKPPKGVLLYGPPGTGKTLLARAVAATLNTNFLKVVSSAIVDKYIGESARVVREMFGYAKEHEPCVIFMDEIDAIGGRRFSEGTSADREIQRTLMEVRSSPWFCPWSDVHSNTVAESNGRFRYPGTNKTHHGHKPTRYPRSSPATARSTGPKDRDPAT
jgi:26S proteasome regulatory subunit T4